MSINPPISEYMHYFTTLVLKKHKVSTVIDVGGTHKLDHRFDVLNANILDGIDGTNLPYSTDEFDASVSIAVLEHVKSKELFLKECIRVAKKVSVHWFPYGDGSEPLDTVNGLKIENFKSSMGHQHPCEVPLYKHLLCLIKEYECNITPLVTCAEHLLMLATMYPALNNDKLYEFILNNNSYLGILLEVIIR